MFRELQGVDEVVIERKEPAFPDAQEDDLPMRLQVLFSQAEFEQEKIIMLVVGMDESSW